VWSNMLGFKRHCEGGYLAVPEYDLALEIADNSLSMFDGQNLLHGVTPMRLTSDGAHRFTIVFYSLKGVWQCLPVDPTFRTSWCALFGIYLNPTDPGHFYLGGHSNRSALDCERLLHAGSIFR